MGTKRLQQRSTSSPSSSPSSSSSSSLSSPKISNNTKSILVAVLVFNFSYYQLRSSIQIFSSSSTENSDNNRNTNIDNPLTLPWWSSSSSSSSSVSDSLRSLSFLLSNATEEETKEQEKVQDGSVVECKDDLDIAKQLILLDINDDIGKDYGGTTSSSSSGSSNSSNDRQGRKAMKMKWYTSRRAGSGTTNELTSQEIEVLMEGPTKWQNLHDLFQTTLAPSIPTKTTAESTETTATTTTTTTATTTEFMSGKFRSFEKNLAPEEEQVQAWLPRLFFLALHHRFHQPAYDEYKNRQQRLQRIHLQRKHQQHQQRQQQQRRLTNPSSNCNHSIAATLTNERTDMETLTALSLSSSINMALPPGMANVISPLSGLVKPPGNFEFICPDSKFLVMGMGSQGFGAFINTSGLTLILAALRTGRIPVFWNIFEPGQKRKKKDWLLAPHDCDEKTMTCYFLPLSPCTLTLDDITNATMFAIEKPDKRWFRRNLALPPDFDDDRVVAVADAGMIPSPFDQERLNGELSTMNRAVINATVQTSMELLSYWKKIDPSLPELPIIEKSIKLMDEQSKVMFAGFEGVWAYLLRLNPKYRRIIGNQTSNVLSSSSKDSTFENSIGLPVRGSDKCIRESTCLSVQTYMELAMDIYKNYTNSHINGPLHNSTTTQTFSVHPEESYHPNLILTTEDAEIFNEAMQFSRNATATTSSGTSDVDYNNVTSSTSPFPYRFLLNSDDNLQGSGNPHDFRHDGHNTVVSSLVAIILQLHASNVYGNCCSNWHKVIRRLVEGGLSSAQDATFTCLNLAPAVFNNEKYRICCQWKKDQQCKHIYKEYNNQTSR